MKLVQNEYYSRQDVAKELSRCILDDEYKVIAITGPSCVGKSTFTEMLTNELGKDVTFQVINVDCYLKEKYRAGTKMWKGPEPHLMPKHFDWEKLSFDLNDLKAGCDVEKQMYVRGIGWSNKETLYAKDVIVLEGLFLDSMEASEFMKYDLLVKLSADDEMIKKKRMERDDYFREHFENFTRTKEETIKEAEQTIKAGKSYTVCGDKWKCVRLKIREDYQAEVQSI